MLCDGYVKYEEAEVDRSVIMQDFRDNEGRKLKIADRQPFWISLVRNLSCAILCFIFMVQLFAFFELRKYHKITEIQNGR